MVASAAGRAEADPLGVVGPQLRQAAGEKGEGPGNDIAGWMFLTPIPLSSASQTTAVLVPSRSSSAPNGILLLLSQRALVEFRPLVTLGRARGVQLAAGELAIRRVARFVLRSGFP